MAGAMEIAQRYDGGFQMHAEETKLQAMSCRQFFGKSAVAHWRTGRTERIGPRWRTASGLTITISI